LGDTASSLRASDKEVPVSERGRIAKLLNRLHSQPLKRFPAARERLDAPDSQGVYIIRDPKRRVLHVGRTLRGKKGLRQRLKNHLGAASSFVIAHLGGNGKRLRNGYTYQYLEISGSRDRILLEYAATVWHCPKHLGDGAGVPK
jgi:hypothetical protein